jgi:HEAT repeat protein
MSQWIWSQSDLIKLAGHKKPEVRRWACERMGTLYGEVGIEILERLLRDKEEDILLEALRYLENYLDPRFKDTLFKMYETKTGIIAGKCAFLLGKLKDERFISAYKRKIHAKTVEFDEVIWSINAMGELATSQARDILKEMLSEMERQEVDPFFINAMIRALIKAKEDLSFLLECYARHYKRFAMEILYPLTSVCGSWYSLEDLKQEGKRKISKKSLPRAVSESLSYLKREGFLSLEEVLHKAFKKQNYREVIEIVWDHVKKIVDESRYKEIEILLVGNDSPPMINYQVLKAFKDFLIRGPAESLKDIAIVTLVTLSRFIEFRSLLGLRVDNLNDEGLFQILFEDRGTLEIDDRLTERLLAICHHEKIFSHSVQQLKDHPFFYGTGRAIQLLGRLKDERAIPDLVDFLKRKGNDDALNQCIKALSQVGKTLIDYLEKNFDQLNQDQQFEILFALEDIPEESTANLLLRYWDKLWSMDKETFLYALEKVASKRFIEPLRKELKEGEVLEEEIFYVLCHIHGVDDILLPQIEKRMMERKKEIEGRLDVLERGDLSGLLNEAVEVELMCRQCGKSYYYEIENIYVTGEKEEPRISDKIICKNCRAINQYEMTTKGRLAILSQLVLMAGFSEKGKLKPEESPIKFAEAGLMDGRRMSFDDVLKYYKKEVQKVPDDPTLRVGYGNVLMKMGMEGEAVFQYQEALRLDPLAVEACASLGEYEGDKGNFSQAYEYFKKAADRIHTGHYYRTKEIDQLKEAIFLNLEHYEEMLGKGREESPASFSQKLIKREKVGRNDPCPCGSGRKYKKCCLNKDEERRSEKTSATPKEIELRERLLSFSSKERYKKDFEKAYHLFWRRPSKEPLILDENEEINFGFFLDWFIHDFTLRNGMTVIEEFYQEKKERLSEEEVSLLKYEIASYLSIYEVLSVTPGVGLRLKDLLTNEAMDILEVKGSLTLVKWDVIFARVIKMGSVNKLSGMITVIPRGNREEILSSIQRTWEKVKKETGRMEWSDFMKSNAQLIHHLIEDRSVKEPIFVTEERNRIVSSKAVYEVKDFNSIRYRLSKEFDFITDIEKEGKEIQWTWLKRGKSKDWEGGESVEGSVILRSEMIRGKGELKWTSLGTITLTPKRLDLWCLSKERLDRGKKRLQEILGDNIQHRIDSYEDIVKKAMERPGMTPAIEEREMAEEYAPIFSKVMGEFVTKWIDEEIPALDGKTPREAVKTPEGREKVEDLLKDWENMEERKRRDGESYIDINVLRQMLNL